MAKQLTSAQMGERRLAAVLFTDVVGYSALVHRDDANAMRLLDEHFRIVRRLAPRFGGQEIKTVGDSVLLAFASAHAATACAVAIQQQHRRRNESARPDQLFYIRIGIHLGDVEYHDGDVFGDGVNIAARLQTLAPVGGIAVSEHVRGQLREELRRQFRSLGPQALKNIETPVEVLVADAEQVAALPVDLPAAAKPAVAAPKPRRARRWLWIAAIAGLIAIVYRSPDQRDEESDADRPAKAAESRTIAVLPFANLSEDKSNVYFADGMQDEILTALARIKSIRVISRTSVEQYRDRPHDLRRIAKALRVSNVIEGGVQRAGNRVRVNVQLIDAHTDTHVWAETYDRELNDLFAVQSDVARAVAQALEATLLPAEAQALAAPPTQNAKAYDWYLQAGYLHRQAYEQNALVGTHEPRAIELYQQALKEDPRFALAWAALAASHMAIFWFVPDRSAERLAAAEAAARRALELQPDLGEAHYAMGLYHYWGHRDYAAALRELELARAALPSDSHVAAIIAAVARRRGDWDKALQAYREVTTLDPQEANHWFELAVTYTALRRFAEADAAMGRSVVVAHDPKYQEALRAFSVFHHTGDPEPFRAALAALPREALANGAGITLLFQFHYLTHDYAAALQDTQAAPDRAFPDTVPRSLLLARAYHWLGQSEPTRRAAQQAEQALKTALKQRPDDPDLHLSLGFACVGLGRKDQAIAMARRAAELLPVSADALDGLAYLEGLAEIYAMVGEQARALELLEQLMGYASGRHLSFAQLQNDPVWDDLRADPRFQILLKRSAGT